MPLSKGGQAVAATTPFLVLSLLVLVLRLYTRLAILKNPGLEDLFVAISWVFAAVLYALICWLVQYHGLGKHITDLTLTEITGLVDFLKVFWVGIFLYNFSLSCAKLSMFIQYLRIFPTGSTRWASWVGLVIVSANLIWGFFVNLFFCVPVDKFWERFTTEEGHCLSERPVYFAFAGANIATSCIIILVPIPAIVKLEMATRTKIALILVFGFGIFDIILGCLRLSSLSKLTTTSDSTYFLAEVSIWSSLESTVAIICASAAVLRPFFTKYAPKFFSTDPRESRAHTSGLYSGNNSAGRKSGRQSTLVDQQCDFDIELHESDYHHDRPSMPDKEAQQYSGRRHVLKQQSSQTWLQESDVSNDESEVSSPTRPDRL